MIKDAKARNSAMESRTARTETQGRRFIRDARRTAPSSGSGRFWYRIWRNLRTA